MQPTEGERKLVAILVADVVGFSRMMGEDEEATLIRYSGARRQIIDAAIAQYGGRIFKELGDGLLVEFPSTVRALNAAVQIQNQLRARNATVVERDRIMLRIGVHQGDVLVQGTDLVGDGVNVAARLEPLAQPGGICISNRVREDAAGRLNLRFEDMGQRELKNIHGKVHVHRVLLNEEAAALEAAAKPVSTGRSLLAGIAVGGLMAGCVAVAAVYLRDAWRPARPKPPQATASAAQAVPVTAAPQAAQAITEALATAPCILARATATAGGVTVTGTVSAGTPETEARLLATSKSAGLKLTWAVRSFTSPYCPVLETIRPAYNAGHLTISLQNGITEAHDGMELQPTVGGMDFPAYVRVESLDANAVNYHMYPTRQDRAAGVTAEPQNLLPAGLSLSLSQPGSTAWTVAPPLGESLIVAIASSEELLASPRRNYEPLQTYLDALGPAILAAQAHGSRLAADVLLVNLLPK